MLNVGDIVKFNSLNYTGATSIIHNPQRQMCLGGFLGVITEGINEALRCKVESLSGLPSAEGIYSWRVEDLLKYEIQSLDVACDVQEELDESFISAYPQYFAEEAEQEEAGVPFGNSPRTRRGQSKPLKKITKEEYLKLTEDYLKKVSSSDIDYSMSEQERTKKEGLYITQARVDIGNIIGDEFRTFSTKRLSDCCQLFDKYKVSEDIKLIVPSDWLGYMGYDSSTILKWINFIQQLGFPTNDITYVPARPVKEHRAVIWSQFNPYFVKNNDYYEIILKATEYNSLNYLTFVLLRYLFHTDYNNIPGLCLLLKEKTYLSNWEILMLAHILGKYPEGHGLYETYEYPECIVIADISDRKNSSHNYFNRLKKLDSINASFINTPIALNYYHQLLGLLRLKMYDKLHDWIAAIPDNVVKPPEQVIEQAPNPRLVNYTFDTPHGVETTVEQPGQLGHPPNVLTVNPIFIGQPEHNN